MDVPPQIEVLWRLLFEANNSSGGGGAGSTDEGCVGGTIGSSNEVLASVVSALIDWPLLIEHSMNPQHLPSSRSQKIIDLRALIRTTIEEEEKVSFVISVVRRTLLFKK